MKNWAIASFQLVFFFESRCKQAKRRGASTWHLASTTSFWSINRSTVKCTAKSQHCFHMNPCYKTKKPKWIYVHEIIFAQTERPWYFLQMMQFQHLHSFMPMKIPSFYGARCDIRILLSFPRFRGVAEKPLCSDQISVEIGAKKTAENGESRWPGTHRDVEPWRQGSFPPKTRPFWPLNFGNTSFGFGKWDPENFREIKVGDFFWKHLAGHKLLFKTKRCPLDIHWKASLIFWVLYTRIYIYIENMYIYILVIWTILPRHHHDTSSWNSEKHWIQAMFCRSSNWAMKKHLRYLLYRRDYTIQLYRDYNKPL